jgi:hypothetical protein
MSNVTGSVTVTDPVNVTVPLKPALPTKQDPTLIDEIVLAVVATVAVARAPLAPGPASERATMLATASQPALRNVAARLLRRLVVSMDLLSPFVRQRFAADDAEARSGCWAVDNGAVGPCARCQS